MVDVRIGQLAAGFRLNPRTIRYYERIGLLPPARRTANGYRAYTRTEVERLGFILKARAIGLSLDEIGEILRLRQAGLQPCRHLLGMLDLKLEAVDEQLRTLSEFRQDLVQIRAEAASAAGSNAAVCPVIEHHTLIRELPLLGARASHASARSSHQR